MKKRPVVVLALFALLGVYTFSGLTEPVWQVNINGMIIISALVVLTGALLFVTIKVDLGIVLAWVLAFFVFGSVTYYQHNAYREAGAFTEGKVAITGTVIDIEDRVDWRRLTVKVSEIDGRHEVSFNVWLYLDGPAVGSSDSFDQEFVYGDRIYAIVNLSQAEVRRGSRELQRANTNLARGIMASGGVTYIEYLGNNTRAWNPRRIAFTVRGYIQETVDGFFPEDEAAIARGMMIGDKSAISDELQDVIKDSGISHLIVVSGLHVGILLMALMAVFKGFTTNRIILKVSAFVFMVVFFLTVGYAPSILRAVLMTVIAMSAGLFWRRSDIFTTIALALLVILMFRPYSMFEAGFQLSFACVLGIALYAAPLGKMDSNLWMKILMLVVLSMATLVCTIYTMARFFNYVNLTAVWTNVIAIPIAQLALIGSYIVVILNVISKTLASFFVPGVHVLLWLLKITTEFAAGHTHVGVSVRPMTLMGVAVYISILYVLYALEKETIRWLKRRSCSGQY